MKQILLYLTWYDYRIHRGVAQIAREAGWHLICPKGEADRKRVLNGWQGDGCIALIDSPEQFETFHAKKIPIVDLGVTHHQFPIPRIATDNSAIGNLAASHFLDRGYREIFMAPSMGIPMFKERLKAAQEGMKAGGGCVTLLKNSNWKWTDVLNQLKKISLDRGGPLSQQSFAFFAYEDYRAAELISVCLEKGLSIPDNIAVLGIDNDDLINEGLGVGLSSVDSDQEGLGRAAAHILQQRLNEPNKEFETNILRHPPLGLTIRKSTDYYSVRSILVANSLRWIHHHFKEGIQAVDVARAMKVTQQGLQKEFSIHHLRSPGEEIRFQRVEAAALQLVQAPAKLSDIAERCGYYTVDSMISNFKKAYGVTPGKYRKQHSSESS